MEMLSSHGIRLGIPPFDKLRVVTVRLCSLSLSKVEGSEAEPPKAGVDDGDPSGITSTQGQSNYS